MDELAARSQSKHLNMVQKSTAGQRFDQNEQQALGVPLPCICQHHLDNRIQFLKAIIYIHIFSLAWQCAQFFRGAHFWNTGDFPQMPVHTGTPIFIRATWAHWLGKNFLCEFFLLERPSKLQTAWSTIACSWCCLGQPTLPRSGGRELGPALALVKWKGDLQGCQRDFKEYQKFTISLKYW